MNPVPRVLISASNASSMPPSVSVSARLMSFLVLVLTSLSPRYPWYSTTLRKAFHATQFPFEDSQTNLPDLPGSVKFHQDRYKSARMTILEFSKNLPPALDPSATTLTVVTFSDMQLEDGQEVTWVSNTT
ncbi:hypothetical protein K438DRAFT_1992304 [Mycena galopus ATCC 62051]|nr:hypothetical protein K438DRAFT_1992304 [Mycena galopus ATCC 62051]